MPKVSVPQYAKSQGISKVAAYKRVKTGKVKVDENGLVDLEEAVVQWEQSRDAIEGAKNPSGLPKPRPSAATHHDDKSSFSEAQRAREWLRVKKEKLAVDIAEARVVDAAEVRKAVSAMISASKSRFMTIADELCDRLASESDAIRCREMVDRKIHEALGALAEWPSNA